MMTGLYQPSQRLDRASRRAALTLTAILLAVLPLEASAQSLNAQRFRPMPSQFTNHFNVAAARPLEHLQWEFGVIYNYADDPLVLNDANGDRVESLISQLHGLNLTGALGLGWIFDVGFNVPLILSQSTSETGRIPSLGEGTFGVGDIYFVPKLRFFSTDTADSPGGVGLALLVPTTFPTGNKDKFQGENFTIEPRLAFDIAHSTGTRFSMNVGWIFRTAAEQNVGGIEVGNSLTYGMAATIMANRYFAIVPELYGESVLTSTDFSEEESPLEALLGFKIWPIEEFLIELGGGTSLVGGFGAPDWRLFLGFAVSIIPVRDRDHDGLTDDIDQCPDDPEDRDGFQDSDGCPDVDNDQDTILDVYDDCPLDPEDLDGFEDADGCPDPDNDQDGVLDVNDGCPIDPEDIDGWQDSDGCPDVDNDFDGLLDINDGCPDEAEDFDEFEDEDGCPDPDNDQDRILDVDDECPNEPENYNGFEDEDGCYDESIVQVDCEFIRIADKVYFETDSATIRSRSFDLLNQVAATMVARPDISLIRVEGHTDDRGSDSHNLDLSDRRANSVRDYLIAQGVPGSRLMGVGYGEDYPIASNRSRDGRSENRRVEFRILDQEGCPDQAPPPY